MHLIEVKEDSGTNKKHYSVNTFHPLFNSLRNIILKYVGIDQILEKVIQKLGNVEAVYLTGDMAGGRNSQVVDLVLVGNIDKNYLYQLIEKVEPMIEKKIRVAVFQSHEFQLEIIENMGTVINLTEVTSV